ncbi:hypothetical protein CPB84DRAFT_1848987 [Gymnopilus junonius]|uniref:Uncharacterized protein n=1 Tax=Gymnopilus junonius TaxID=109634 RepID=A0A9P5TK95_GYMJU|nr:hypothetical protein CPB84DRAFT_1848987 [Gymnopilus junonius]
MPKVPPNVFSSGVRMRPYDAPEMLVEPSNSACRYPLRTRAVRTVSTAAYALALRRGHLPSESAALAVQSSRELGAEPAAPESSGVGAHEASKPDPPCLNWPQTRILGAEPAALEDSRQKPVGCSPTHRRVAEPAAMSPAVDSLESGRASSAQEDSSPTHRRVAEPAAMSTAAESSQEEKDASSTYWSEFSLSSTLPVYFEEAKKLGVCVEDEPTDANNFNLRGGAAALLSTEGTSIMRDFLEKVSSLQPPPSNASAPKRSKRGGVRARAVNELAQGNGFIAKHLSLAMRAYQTGALHISQKFSTVEDGSYVSTGWHGRAPSVQSRKEITLLWKSGRIKQILGEQFYPISYSLSKPKPALLIDRELRTFGYRTTQFDWIKDNADALHSAIESVLRPHLDNPKLAAEHANGSRGPHFPCVIGHHQQYTKAPTLTQFHIQNVDAVKKFCESPIIQRLSQLVSRLIITIFPGVALRAIKSALWHKERNDIKPLFGLYWNFCINGMFSGQKRIFTSPHADAKNIIGICAIVVYVIPGKAFNHQKKAWLVLWEAGVVVELPPWVVFLYPSSLLYHFNIDVEDIRFVLTDGEKPTPENSTPLGGEGDEGRGSLVFFNQASMYHGSEMGFNTLTEARNAGMSGSISSAEQVNLAFSQQVHTVDVNMEEMNEVVSMLTTFD